MPALAAVPWILGALGIGAVGGTFLGLKFTEIGKVAAVAGVAYLIYKGAK